MDQYLSTYSKDFLWPSVKKNSPDNTDTAGELYEGHACICGAEPGGYLPPKQYASTPVADNYQWSRLDPMGPLLDPKLYPTKMGPVPEFETTRYDQPNTYLKKLEEKYPYLYNVLRSAPSDDMIRRVNEDRLRTTYQVDYGHIDEHPSAEYDNLLADSGHASDHSGTALLDCRGRVRSPDDSGQKQPQRSTNGSGGSGPVGNGSNGSGPVVNGSNGSAGRSPDASNGKSGAKNATAEKNRNLSVKAVRNSGGGKTDDGGIGTSGGDGSKRTGKKSSDPNDSNATKNDVPAWISEYQDVIGQTGLDIVRDKLHQHGTKSPGQIFMERAVMHCRAHS